MTPSTRGLVARALAITKRPQSRRLASSSSSAPRPPRQASATPSAKPYKPTTRPPPNSGSRNAPPPPPKPEDATLLDHWRTAWLPLSGAALLAGFLGFYIFGTAAASLKSTCSSPSCLHGGDANGGDDAAAAAAAAGGGAIEHSTPTGRPPALTGDNAALFDKELDLPEWWMGVSSLRRRLAAAATGHVLEVAVGSGRNLEHYNWDALSAAVALASSPPGDDNNSGDNLSKKNKKTMMVRPRGITSFTGLDISIDMLDLARRKLAAAVPPLAADAPTVRAASFPGALGSQLSLLNGHIRLIAADAHDPLPPPAQTTTSTAPPPSTTTTTPSNSPTTTTTTTSTTTNTNTSSSSSSTTTTSTPTNSPYYDTITQTFGLCSVRDPVAVLANLARAVRPLTGRIILLEHGKGFYGLVNGLLDRNAHKHFAKYGCWWNRDIEALVEEAARVTPGLEIVKIERPNITQMGTLIWIELRVVPEQPGK